MRPKRIALLTAALFASLALVELAGSAWMAGNGQAVAQTVNQSTAGQDRPLTPTEQQIRDYLLAHPEVIVEALQRYELQQRGLAAVQVRKVITERRDEILRDPAAPVGGNPDGDVSIVEFFDYNCPYCRKNAPILKELETSDSGLRFVYKEWPILGPDSEFAARAALASARQDKYIAFHRALMATSEKVTEAKVLSIAESVGIDLARLRQDLDDPAIQQAIERNHALAKELGITGTPSFVINDGLQPGFLELPALRGLIAQARGGQTTPETTTPP